MTPAREDEVLMLERVGGSGSSRPSAYVLLVCVSLLVLLAMIERRGKVKKKTDKDVNKSRH